jgi:hypothetical protein
VLAIQSSGGESIDEPVDDRAGVGAGLRLVLRECHIEGRFTVVPEGTPTPVVPSRRSSAAVSIPSSRPAPSGTVKLVVRLPVSAFTVSAPTLVGGWSHWSDNIAEIRAATAAVRAYSRHARRPWSWP